MNVSKEVLKKVQNTPELKIFDYSLFKNIENKQALSKAISRLVEKGIIDKLNKGKFYKPQKTKFGIIKPSENEIISNYIKKGNKTIGYLTGINMYLNLGLTTQMAHTFEIATNKIERKKAINNVKLIFNVKKAPIKEENIKCLQLLDCLENIKNIPGTSTQKAYSKIKNIILELEEEEKKKMIELSKYYRIGVAVLLGTILENEVDEMLILSIRERMNPYTKYNYAINFEVDKKERWKIKMK